MSTNDPGTERRQAPRGRLRLLRDLLYATLRFIARHIRGFWGALVAFLTVGVIIGLLAVAIFALFATAVEKGLTQTLDERTLTWFESHRTPGRDEFMSHVTTLGDGVVLWMLVIVASLFLWQTRHHWSVALLFIGVIGGSFLNEALKVAFGRARPGGVAHLDAVSSMSFPSGHAMVSLITYGSVAYLVARLEPTPRLRNTTWIVAGVIVAGIGISRMYLGVHYPSDVIAGFLAGLAWLAFVASGVTAVRFFSPRRPEVRREEKDLDAEAQRAVGVRE
jgi:undecaprenyl-diphosphatase